MAGYQPLYIKGMETGLVQSRENFILPNDAYPTLINAYVWRERIKRKKGYQLLGRLQRNFISQPIGTSSASNIRIFNFYTTVVPNIPETPASTSDGTASLVPGSIVITGGGDTFTDQGNGTFMRQDGDTSSTINYVTGAVRLVRTVATVNAFLASYSYYPGLPVMGIRIRENQNSTFDETVFWDTVYAYNWNSSIGSFEEFLPGTTWTGQNYEFFWTTNYWVGIGNAKIFWATNFSVSGDPIRYCTGLTGSSWVDFQPIIDSAGNTLNQCLAMLPFRGRLVTFNTRESTGAFSNRIRWSAIGNPFTTTSSIVSSVNANAWRDDIRGQGGFLDIPTAEDIVSVGFVRDNVVIYCERTTWQLRYTGRSIAPFQIERVNSEIGSASTFSSIQFDTSLLTIGDKGIIECDSYKSEHIDIKIPDFVFTLSDNNQGQARIQGVRDFVERLAYWTYVSDTSPDGNIFPNQRLVYNYENDSWAIFTDSLTALGTFQLPSNRTWLNTHLPWIQCNFPWINQPFSIPAIVGGNQQGWIEYLDEQTTNDPSLYIATITPNGANPVTFLVPLHNMAATTVVEISGIPVGTPYAYLNGMVFQAIIIDPNTISLNSFDPASGQFSIPLVDTTTGFVGVGNIEIRDNFNITSKKFNFLDDGQSIQIGYLDILLAAVKNGAITMNMYLDYNDDQTSNTLPKNAITGISPGLPDGFFNQTVATSQSALNNIGGTKFWQRVICPTRANFLTLQYTFSNAQMAGMEQQLNVQIDSQIIWMRKGGRLNQF